MAATRSVHWNDQQSSIPFKERNDYSTIVKRHGQRISLNASLPFHSKLNIRIHANRVHSNEDNQVQTTATIQRLSARDDEKHFQALQQAYSGHYSTHGYLQPIRKTQSPVEYGQQARHQRHIAIPASLSMDKRLFFYFRNGEIFVRF